MRGWPTNPSTVDELDKVLTAVIGEPDTATVEVDPATRTRSAT
jgi:hypothetical protein